MKKGNGVTFMRIGPDGQMAMPSVIPFSSTTALPAWDDRSFLTRHSVDRNPRVACLAVAPLKRWLAALQATREQTFKMRRGWEAVAVDLTGRTPLKDKIVSDRPAPLWEKEMTRGGSVYALALTKNAAIALDRHSSNGPWEIAALDRRSSKELWRLPLPAEPLISGLSVRRNGDVLVTLTDGRIACFGYRFE